MYSPRENDDHREAQQDGAEADVALSTKALEDRRRVGDGGSSNVGTV